MRRGRDGAALSRPFASALFAAGVANGVVLATALAPRAAEAAPSARLTYVREAGAERCADESGLRRAVAARIGYDPFFVWARVTVVAVVRRDTGTFRAEVTLVDDGGVSRGTRTLSARGDDCAPLVSALALSISLALDPLSLKEHEPPPEPPAPPAPPAAPEPKIVEPRPQRSEPPPEPRPPPPPAWSGWLGLAATGSDGVTPNASFGGAARARLTRDGLSLGIEGGADLPTFATAAAGGSIAAWTARGSFLGCGRLSIVSACVVATGGALVASGQGLTTARSAVVGYGSAGPRVGVEWALSRRFVFEAFAEVGFVFARRALQVDGADVFRQAVAAPRLGLGVSTRIF